MPGGGGSSPAPAPVFQPGNTASVYQPQAQPQFDQLYQQIASLFGQGGLQGLSNIGNPAAWGYPYAQAIAGNMLPIPGTQGYGYGQEALAGAQTAYSLGQSGGLNLYNLGQEVTDLAHYSPVINNLQNLGTQVAAPIGQIQAYGQQVADTAFDPQQALKNQEQRQITDQTRASLASSGLAGSPYAAGIEGHALEQFGLDWQNQQLQRQLAGLKGMTGADVAAGSLGQMGGGLQQQSLQDVLQGYTTGANLEQAGLGQIAGTASLPYQTLAGQMQTGLGDLSSAINIGAAGYQIPQQTLNDLQSYLQLGQSSSGLGGQLGQAGVNQQLQQAALLSQGLGGIGGLAAIGGQNGLGLWGGGSAATAGLGPASLGGLGPDIAVPGAVAAPGAAEATSLSAPEAAPFLLGLSG